MAPSAEKFPGQMGDVCHRMVDRKRKPEQIQSPVSAGLPNRKSLRRSVL